MFDILSPYLFFAFAVFLLFSVSLMNKYVYQQFCLHRDLALPRRRAVFLDGIRKPLMVFSWMSSTSVLLTIYNNLFPSGITFSYTSYILQISTIFSFLWVVYSFSLGLNMVLAKWKHCPGVVKKVVSSAALSFQVTTLLLLVLPIYHVSVKSMFVWWMPLVIIYILISGLHHFVRALLADFLKKPFIYDLLCSVVLPFQFFFGFILITSLVGYYVGKFVVVDFTEWSRGFFFIGAISSFIYFVSSICELSWKFLGSLQLFPWVRSYIRLFILVLGSSLLLFSSFLLFDYSSSLLIEDILPFVVATTFISSVSFCFPCHVFLF